MKVIAFLQLYNELSNGHLMRCLNNCKQWADDIFIYDDCSNDGSYEEYLKYTLPQNIIVGETREFDKEQYHKQQLLNIALKSNPDWIGWIDGDTVLCKDITENCKDILVKYSQQNIGSIMVHNINLWKHPAWFRLDSQFNDLWHVVFWRNNGNLSYNPSKCLHGNQFPDGLGPRAQLAYNQPLLHYGFASEEGIVRKYLTYKSYIQKGTITHGLDRLITEGDSYQLEKVPKEWYPQNCIPEDYDTVEQPSKTDFDKYKEFNSYEEYLGEVSKKSHN